MNGSSNNTSQGLIELQPSDFESNNFQKLGTQFNKKITIVKFYSPSCGYCIKSQPDYIALADTLKDESSYVVAQLDCSKYSRELQVLNDFLFGYKVEGYPTYVIFINSLYYKIYEGDRSLNSLLNVLSSIKTSDQNTI